MGAALAQISGTFDQVIVNTPRDVALSKVQKAATEAAVRSGAKAETVKVVEMHEVPLSYIPGNDVSCRCFKLM